MQQFISSLFRAIQGLSALISNEYDMTTLKHLFPYHFLSFQLFHPHKGL